MTKANSTVGRAVVCDDDTLLRSVIGQVLTEAGFVMAGEASTAQAALAAVDRCEPAVVVVDLALEGGSGEELLATIRARWPHVRTVVYSAYATDPAGLRAAGAFAVIDKPDFAALGEVLHSLADDVGLRVERRRPNPREIVPLPPPTTVSLSGFEPWESFLAAASALAVGDAVLAADVVPNVAAAHLWDDVVRVDHRLALGRALAHGRRARDRISLSPRGLPVVLLVAGHAEVATAVYQRLADTWAREVDSGTPVGAFGLVRDGDDPLDRLVAVEQAVPDDRHDRLRMV